MLRVSINKTERNIDLAMINGENGNAEEVAFAQELMEFAGAVADFESPDLENKREQLLQNAGSAVLVDAAGVAGNFQRMVRIADSMGIPVDSWDELGTAVREELDLFRFKSAENSPRPDSGVR